MLAAGTRLFALGSMGALFTALGCEKPASPQDWIAQFREKQQGGHGSVKSLRGQARAAGRKLKVGAEVASGEEVKVGADSLLILRLSDNTTLRINEKTVVTIDISSKRTGLFKLVVGSLLTVMPKGNRYLAQLPNAVVGVKGTVFFQQVYHPDETHARDENNKLVALPKGIGEYFCLCNGKADYMNARVTSLHFTDKSKYHNSYYIDASGPRTMVDAPQLNHTDEQIEELITYQEEPRHSSKFLDNYRYEDGEYD